MEVLRRFIYILLTSLTGLQAGAQQLNFFKPDNLKQLPSSECYNIMQDGRGYIWFSTEAGLCRYNGNTIKIYGAKEGLPEGATYAVFEDRQKRMWVISSKSRILAFHKDKDSLVEVPFSKTFNTTLKKGLAHINFVKTGDDSILWFTTQQASFKANMYTNTVERVFPNDSSVYYLKSVNHLLVPLKTKLSDARFEQGIKNKLLDVTVEKGGKTMHIPLPYTQDYLPTNRVLTAINKKGEMFIGVGVSLIKINPNLTWQIYDMQYSILDLYLDKEDGLWIATFKGGTSCFPNSVISDETRITSLSGLSVSGICEDAEKGIWCTTLEKGVFYCRNKNVINYQNVPGLDKKPTFLRSVGTKIFTSCEKENIFEVKNNQVRKIKIKNTTTFELTDIIRSGDSYLLAGKNFMTRADTLFKKYKNIMQVDKPISIGAYQLAEGKDQQVYSIHFGDLWEIKNYVPKWLVRPLKSQGICLCYTSKGRLFTGCKDGLFEFDFKRDSLSKLIDIAGITKIIESADHKLWICTRGNGIYVKRNGAFEKISDSLHLPTDRFFDICEDRYKSIWLASNMGLIKIAKPYHKENVKVYNILNGILSDEVFRVAVDEGRVYAGTYEGLCSFSIPCDLANATPPPVWINAFKVNNKNASVDQNMRFAYNENNFKISCDALTFKQAGAPIRLMYRLQGNEDEKHFIEGHQIQLNNLSPGSYTLSIFAVNNSEAQSAVPATLHFEIKKPFWQRPLFLSGAVLVLIALFYFFVRIAISRVTKKEQEKTRVNKLLAEYQMSALRAQMNPHFIFNCINSIQRYILTNKADEAYNYLAKFSKLIRLVLNYAEENLISLAQELEIVELYVGLEQLRFENKFSYEIEMCENTDANDVMVPVMLLQPYIENAIWHGLMNLEKGKAGYIRIKINREEEIVQVVIEDNGVGRQRAGLLGKKNHRSKATNINSKRAEILNIISSSSKGNVVIEDIKDKNDTVLGTRVIIYIPQNTDEDE